MLVFHFNISILCNLILVLDSILEVNVVRLSGSLLDNFSLILTVKKKHQMELTGTSFTYFYISKVLNAGFLLVGGFLVQVSYNFLF